MTKNQKKRKRKADALEAVTPLRTKVSIVVAGVLMVLVLAGGIATCYQRSTLTGPYRENYEGQVLEKYVTHHESEEGSSVTNHLLVKEKSGEQFQVVVSSATFTRAQVGMLIRRKGGAIELSADGRDWK